MTLARPGRPRSPETCEHTHIDRKCRVCVRRYNREYMRGRHYKGQYVRCAHLTMGAEEKTRVTESAVAASFSEDHARALHRIAFMPELVGEEDLQMWTEVVAALVLGDQ
jgi:hypothetical protein